MLMRVNPFCQHCSHCSMPLFCVSRNLQAFCVRMRMCFPETGVFRWKMIFVGLWRKVRVCVCVIEPKSGLSNTDAV